jgi:hypothetical protein
MIFSPVATNPCGCRVEGAVVTGNNVTANECGDNRKGLSLRGTHAPKEMDTRERNYL